MIATLPPTLFSNNLFFQTTFIGHPHPFFKQQRQLNNNKDNPYLGIRTLEKKKTRKTTRTFFIFV
jgi:hypothetical protein